MPQRVRSRSNIAALDAQVCQLMKNSPSSCAVQTGQYSSGKTEHMTDVVTARYSKRRNSGELINSPMSRTVYTFKGAELYPTSWRWTNIDGWANGLNYGFHSDDPIGLRFRRLAFPESKLPPWDDVQAGIALANARANASAPAAQLLVSLGEARETLAMLGSAVNLALKRTEPFRVLRKRYETGKLSYRDFLVEAANLDLLVRYGIMPLVYDIEGYVKALSEPNRPDRRTARAVVRDSGNEHWVETGSSGMVANITLDHDLTWTREYRATCLFEAVDDLQARLGLRLADVPTAAWELTRLSFVADWFANIGEYVGSLTLGARATVVLQCVVERLTAQYTATYNESGSLAIASGSTIVSECVNDGSGSEVSIVATRTTRLPYSTTDPGVLSARVKLTPQRVIDGLSLLATSMDISDRKTRKVRI